MTTTTKTTDHLTPSAAYKILAQWRRQFGDRNNDPLPLLVRGPLLSDGEAVDANTYSAVCKALGGMDAATALYDTQPLACHGGEIPRFLLYALQDGKLEDVSWSNDEWDSFALPDDDDDDAAEWPRIILNEAPGFDGFLTLLHDVPSIRDETDESGHPDVPGAVFRALGGGTLYIEHDQTGDGSWSGEWAAYILNESTYGNREDCARALYQFAVDEGYHPAHLLTVCDGKANVWHGDDVADAIVELRRVAAQQDAAPLPDPLVLDLKWVTLPEWKGGGVAAGTFLWESRQFPDDGNGAVAAALQSIEGKGDGIALLVGEGGDVWQRITRWNDHLSWESDDSSIRAPFAFLRTPLKTEQDAKVFIANLFRADAAFHPDDEPAGVIDGARGDRPLFHAAELYHVRERRRELFDLIPDPCAFMIPPEGGERFTERGEQGREPRVGLALNVSDRDRDDNRFRLALTDGTVIVLDLDELRGEWIEG